MFVLLTSVTALFSFHVRWYIRIFQKCLEAANVRMVIWSKLYASQSIPFVTPRFILFVSGHWYPQQPKLVLHSLLRRREVLSPWLRLNLTLKRLFFLLWSNWKWTALHHIHLHLVRTGPRFISIHSLPDHAPSHSVSSSSAFYRLTAVIVSLFSGCFIVST